jgi:hypothetical protein
MHNIILSVVRVLTNQGYYGPVDDVQAGVCIVDLVINLRNHSGIRASNNQIIRFLEANVNLSAMGHFVRFNRVDNMVHLDVIPGGTVFVVHQLPPEWEDDNISSYSENEDDDVSNYSENEVDDWSDCSHAEDIY